MGSHGHFARRSLRLRLLVLLLVPILSLAALWAFAAYLTARDAIGKYEASTAYHKVAVPGSVLFATLQQERVSTAVMLSTNGRQGRAQVEAARTGTDAAQAGFRRSALSADARGAMNRVTEQRLTDLLRRLDGLRDLRARADSAAMDSLQAITDYNAVVDSLTNLFSGLIILNDLAIYQQGTAIISASTANELMMREDALVTAALATKRQRLSGDAYAMFVRSVNNSRYLFDSGVADLKPSLRGPLDRLAGSAEFTAFRGLEDAIIANGAGASLAPQAQSWRVTVPPLRTSWVRATSQAGAVLTAEAKPIGDRITLLVYAAAGIGLLAMVLSILVSVLFGRGLTGELTGLQRAALDLAEERLPRAVKRLREGENVDVAAEVPPVEVGKSREISMVAEALTTLQRTAIQAAVAEARLRQGINQVFLNLAWRSQSLLHRQLSMLDTMERQATDPDALEDLFALDHLTTRMRRHAEGLVILSGAPPARGWHNPVAIRDVLRGAIAEVEDYSRVVVEAAAPIALVGPVVADITHLLAELIENATAFSPAPTPVHIRSEQVANGYAVEVEDRGIGMDAAELADANDRLSHPPEFDLADSDRLGLFIIGKLAARHGIRVTLGPSPYGGARAVVLIPPDLVVRDDGLDYEHAWTDAPMAEPAGHPVPGAEQPPPSAARRYIASPRELAPPAMPDPEGDDDAPELPRRIRQASLAPQLRQASPHPETAGASSATTRPPEETRSLMASLQRGWERGRQDEGLDE